MKDIECLRDWLEITGALKRGRFQLQSGRFANYYLDSKMLMTYASPEPRRLVGALMAQLIRGKRVDAVGGLATGAIPIGMAISDASAEMGREVPWFWVREEKKEHGTRKRIEGNFPSQPGAQVIIVDDVVTTGESVEKAIDAAKQAGAEIVGVLAIVERHEHQAEGEPLRRKGYHLTALFRTDEEGQLHITYPESTVTSST